MSSAILSPHTNPLSLSDTGSRSSRTRLSYSKRNRGSTSNSASSSSKRERRTSSPIGAVTSGSTTRSTRSSARLSTSPEKKSEDLKQMTANDNEDLFDDDMSTPPSVSPRLNDDKSSVMDNITVGGSGSGSASQELEEEEGEDEIEEELEEEEEIEEEEEVEKGSTRNLTPLTPPPPVIVDPPRTTRIRLNIGGVGSKRKAEEDLDDAAAEIPEPLEKVGEEEIKPEEELGEEARPVTVIEVPASHAPSEGDLTPPPERDHEKEQLEAAIQSIEKEPLKRQPRKKRKWLKKGEVDPEDEVAVARQQERWRMIDEAVRSLDEQERLIKEGEHPQYTALLNELDRRLEIQKERCERRYEAQLVDLQRMRDHDLRTTRENFIFKRENLVNDMSVEARRAMAQLSQERTWLNRIPNDQPALRDGRGGGGWQFYEGKSLAKHEEILIPVAVGSKKMRKAIQLDVTSIGHDEGKSDLALMLVTPDIKRSPSSTPPRRVQTTNGRSGTQRAKQEPHTRPIDRNDQQPLARPPSPHNQTAQASHAAQTSSSTPFSHHIIRNGYALHGKEASYAITQPRQSSNQLSTHRNELNGNGRDQSALASSSSQNQRTLADRYLTWSEYLATATRDFYGAALPTDPWDRERVLRDSFEKYNRRVTSSMILPASAQNQPDDRRVPLIAANPRSGGPTVAGDMPRQTWEADGRGDWYDRMRAGATTSTAASTLPQTSSTIFRPGVSPRPEERSLIDPGSLWRSERAGNGAAAPRLPEASVAADPSSRSRTYLWQRQAYDAVEREREREKEREKERQAAADRFRIPPFRGQPHPR